jgi:hypothetical protein
MRHILILILLCLPWPVQAAEFKPMFPQERKVQTIAPQPIAPARSGFPLKTEGPNLNAKGNEVAIESLDLAHEGISLEDADDGE